MSTLEVALKNDSRGLLTLQDDVVSVTQVYPNGQSPKTLLSSPVRLVLRATLSSTSNETSSTPAAARLDLHVLRQQHPTGHDLHLAKLHFLVEAERMSDAEEWVGRLMTAAYPVSKPFRKLLVVVNPASGKGKGVETVQKLILPILEAAGCEFDVIETTHSGHAEQVTEGLKLGTYDAIAVAGGDGTVYEVLNGLARQADAFQALRTPIVPLPTGSGCASAVAIYGIEDAFNIQLSALNAVKGQAMPVDLCSFLLLPENVQRVSFLSAAFGLMVDLDLGTEQWRWMGDTRFLVGFLKYAVRNKNLKARLQLDVVDHDKDDMAERARQAATEDLCGEEHNPHGIVIGVQTPATSVASSPVTEMPPATSSSRAQVDNTSASTDSTGDDRHGPLPVMQPLEPTADWVTVDSGLWSKKHQMDGLPHANEVEGGWKEGKGISWVYAGMLPYPSRDFNQWPVAQTGSGVIDVVVQSRVPFSRLVGNITGAEHGETFWDPSVHYYKVRAFTAENLDKANQPFVSIDGEGFAFDKIHFKVIPRAARFLSLDGRIQHSQFLTGKTSKAEAKSRERRASKSNGHSSRRTTM